MTDSAPGGYWGVPMEPPPLAAAPQQAPVGWQLPPQVAAAPRAGMVEQNRFTLTVLAVVAAYILLAVTTRIVFLGILPVMMSMRAMKRREPFGVVAVAAAGMAVLVALFALH